ncbi:MAG TPA: DUF721 domain-containing protein [Candidatus Coprenecus pullistercoris]|nr:DUF721 domain-containing protein [Candidatus Coprenecus pullistercoris]
MQRTGPIRIGEALGEYVRETGLTGRFLSMDVSQAWLSVVDGREAAATRSSRFSDGVLYCTVSSSIIRSRLQFRAEEIRHRINVVMGGDVVRKIVLR